MKLTDHQRRALVHAAKIDPAGFLPIDTPARTMKCLRRDGFVEPYRRRITEAGRAAVAK